MLKNLLLISLGVLVQLIVGLINAEKFLEIKKRLLEIFREYPTYRIKYEGGFPIKHHTKENPPKRYSKRYPEAHPGRSKGGTYREYDWAFEVLILDKGMSPYKDETWQAYIQECPLSEDIDNIDRKKIRRNFQQAMKRRLDKYNQGRYKRKIGTHSQATE